MRYLNAWLAGQRLNIDRLRKLNWTGAGTVLFNWAVVLTGLLMAQGLGSVVTIVIARRVLPVDFGQYLACASVASLLLVFPTLGMDNWLLAQGDADPVRIAALWQSALRARIGLLGLWLVAMLGLGFLLPRATYPLYLLLPIAVMLAAESIVALDYSALRLLGQHRRVTGLQSVFAVASLVIALLLPLVAHRIIVFAFGTALVAVVSAVPVTSMASRLLRRPASMSSTATLFRAARSFMLGDVAVLVYSRATFVMISLIRGAAGAAVFGPADSLISATFWVPTALYFLVLPGLSREHSGGRPGSFSRLGVAQLVLQGVTGLVLSALVFALAPFLIRLLFGSAYDAAIPFLQLTSPIPFFKSLNFGLGAWLTSSRRQADRTGVQIVVGAFTVIAGLLAISRWGLTGAAAVEVANESLLSVGYGGLVAYRWRAARRPEPIR